MLDAARRIAQRIAHVNRDEFDGNEDLRDALAHRIQIIGEAASKISQKYRAKHSEIPWAKIIGMRHRIVHDYMNVDFDILWQTTKQDIGELVILLETLAERRNVE